MIALAWADAICSRCYAKVRLTFEWDDYDDREITWTFWQNHLLLFTVSLAPSQHIVQYSINCSTSSEIYAKTQPLKPFHGKLNIHFEFILHIRRQTWMTHTWFHCPIMTKTHFHHRLTNYEWMKAPKFVCSICVFYQNKWLSSWWFVVSKYRNIVSRWHYCFQCVLQSSVA